MTFASGAFGQLRYIPETVIGTTPGAGNAINLRQTGPTMKAAMVTTSTQEIRSDRLGSGLTRTDLNVDGGFNFELSGKEYDPFLEGLLCSNFTHYGTGGIGTTFGLTTAALSLTAAVAPTTTSAFTTLAAGDWIKVIPPAGASAAQKLYFADAWFKTASIPTSTVITLDASTPITGAGLGITAVAGYAISKSTLQNAGVMKGFTLEYAMSDINQFLPFTGMRVNTMDLNISVGSIITGSFGFFGQGHGGMVGATTLPGTPVASQTLEVMNAVADVGALYEAGTNVLGASSFIKSIKLQVSNNMRGQKAVGVFGNAGVGFGELAITGTLECYVSDAAYYQKWFTGTNTSLAIGLADSAGNGYMLDLEKVTFKDGGFNPGNLTTDAMLTLPFQAFYNPATGRGMRITRSVAA